MSPEEISGDKGGLNGFELILEDRGERGSSKNPLIKSHDS